MVPVADVASLASKLPTSASSYGFPSQPGLMFSKSPKHRAWGGETEPPVQAKAIPNVDMSKVNGVCVCNIVLPISLFL